MVSQVEILITTKDVNVTIIVTARTEAIEGALLRPSTTSFRQHAQTSRISNFQYLSLSTELPTKPVYSLIEYAEVFIFAKIFLPLDVYTYHFRSWRPDPAP